MNIGGCIIFGICIGATLYAVFRAMKDCMPEDHEPCVHPKTCHVYPPMHQMSIRELLKYCDDLEIERPNTQSKKEICNYIKKQLQTY